MTATSPLLELPGFSFDAHLDLAMNAMESSRTIVCSHSTAAIWRGDTRTGILAGTPSALAGLAGQVSEHSVREIFASSLGVRGDARLVTTVGELVLSREIAEPAV
jgi:hypothetical protein